MTMSVGLDKKKGDMLIAQLITDAFVRKAERASRYSLHMERQGEAAPVPFHQEIAEPSSGLRSVEIEWLSSNAGNLRKYEGKWIALEGDKIVSWGSDEVAVEMRAREKGIKVPLLVRVPSKDDIPFVGSNLHDSDNIR